jgi:anti-sigma B factor antagonist
MTPLTIVERQAGGVTILELAGELKLGDTSDELAARLHMLLKARKPRLVLQLERVERLDSVGIGTIIDAVRQARAAGGEVLLVSPSQKVREVLGFLQLDKRPDLVRVFTTESEALASLAPAS